MASSTKTGRSNRSRRAGARIEAMSAPNPFCPNVKGVCCLMLLLNLGLILVTLGETFCTDIFSIIQLFINYCIEVLTVIFGIISGFVIVIQFIEPLFVW